MVITYELFILTAVFFTIIGVSMLLEDSSPESDLYDVQISVDKIGILVKAEPSADPSMREIFTLHHATEISEGH